MPATIVSFYTPAFAVFADQLRQDCWRHGHPCHIQLVDCPFANLIQVFDHKVEWIREQVIKFGRVIWLDVECRLLRPIPSDWAYPFMTFYGWDRNPRHPSSGVFGVGSESLPMLEQWYQMAVKYPVPDDFVLEALLHKRAYKLFPIEMEFVSRKRKAPVVRGQWVNSATVIQHPTINRWVDPLKYKKTFGSKIDRDRGDPLMRARKHLFIRNYGGCFDDIHHRMEMKDQPPFHEHGWFFDPSTDMMAPENFWPEAKGNFRSKPTNISRYLEQFQKDLRVDGYRQAQVAHMAGFSRWRRWFSQTL